MQTDNIKIPALIEPFFNLEIDFKNDYVEYISSTNQSAVTPQSNIIINQNKTCAYLTLNSDAVFLYWVNKENCFSIVEPNFPNYCGNDFFFSIIPQSQNDMSSLM